MEHCAGGFNPRFGDCRRRAGSRVSAEAQSPSATKALEAQVGIESTFPGVRFYRDGDEFGPGPNGAPEQAVRAVYGVPMTSGATAKDAAADFLGQFGEVFGIVTPDLQLARDSLLLASTKTETYKRALRFEQSIQGVAVEGAAVRLLAIHRPKVNTIPNEAWQLIWAEGSVWAEPLGGVPEPKISAQQAKAAAQAKHAALKVWSEPSLTLIPDPEGLPIERRTRLCWIVNGSSDAVGHDAMGLAIDAVTEKVVREQPLVIRHGGHGQCDHSATKPGDASNGRWASQHMFPRLRASVPLFGVESGAREAYTGELTSASAVEEPAGLPEASFTISGTVRGYRTPDWWADTRAPQFASCEKLPVLATMPDVKIEALQGTTVVGTAYSGANGAYSVTVPSNGSYEVRATLGGPNWTSIDTNPTGQPLSVSVTSSGGQSGVTLSFGSVSNPTSENAVAQQNIQVWVSAAHGFWTSQSADTPLTAEFLVISNADFIHTTCGGSYSAGFDVVTLGKRSTPPPDPCPNPGSGTIICHEYGHRVLVKQELIPFSGMSAPYTAAFHEGYSDSTSGIILPSSGSQQPTILGPHFGGVCGQHAREPLVAAVAFPKCDGGLYERGQLLAAIWMELRGTIGEADSANLFALWTTIATAPGGGAIYCGDEAKDQSASTVTYLQVLTADDDDGNLSNGTPHLPEICAVFTSRLVPTPGGVTCPDGWIGAPFGTSRASTARPGLLDVAAFLAAWSGHDPRADLNKDGVLDTLDVALFAANTRKGVLP